MKKYFVVLTVLLSLAVSSIASAQAPKYEYNFDGSLGGAQAVRREGDNEDGGGAGVLPSVDATDSVAYAEGINGQAIDLDGSYGLVLDAAGVGETYTLAFWINPARFSNFGPIIQIGSDLLGENASSTWMNITKTDWDGDIAPVIWSRNEAADTFPWYQTAYYAADGIQLERNEWNHIVVTVDGSKEAIDPVTEELIPNTVLSQLFINGEFIGEGPVAKDTFVGDAKVYVGINPWDIILKGLVDDIKIYDVALSSDEVSTLASVKGQGGSAEAAADSGTETTVTPKTGVESFSLLFGLGVAAFGTGAIVLKKKEK